MRWLPWNCWTGQRQKETGEPTAEGRPLAGGGHCSCLKDEKETNLPRLQWPHSCCPWKYCAVGNTSCREALVCISTNEKACVSWQGTISFPRFSIRDLFIDPRGGKISRLFSKEKYLLHRPAHPSALTLSVVTFFFFWNKKLSLSCKHFRHSSSISEVRKAKQIFELL